MKQIFDEDSANDVYFERKQEEIAIEGPKLPRQEAAVKHLQAIKRRRAIDKVVAGAFEDNSDGVW